MKKDLGPQLGLYPAPVAVIGAMQRSGKPTWTLVAHMGILGHDHVLVSLASSHFINGAIKAAGTLSINLVDQALLPEAEQAGAVSGAKTDKSGFFPYQLGESGVPILTASPLTMACTVEHIYPTPGFENFLCTLDHTYVEQAYLTPGGKIDYRALKPVLFEFPTYEYVATGEVLGKCLTFHRDRGAAQAKQEVTP